MDETFRALIELGGILQSRGYRFVAIAPATHGRVLRRAAAATSLESIFGWNRPFPRDVIDGNLIKLLEEANALDEQDGLYKSKVRFATIDDLFSYIPVSRRLSEMQFSSDLIPTVSCGCCAHRLQI